MIKGETPKEMARYQQMARLRPEPGGAIYRDIIYKKGYTRKLDIYMPSGAWESASDNIPAVVVVHGGSWMHGSKEDIRIIDRFLDRMRNEGWAVISIDYVSSPLGILDAPSRNVRKALKWIKNNAGVYGIDPNNLGIYSFSAGSHLAMEALNASKKPGKDWRFWVNEYGPVDLLAMAAGEAFKASAVFARFPDWYLRKHSPIFHIRAPFPPTKLIHGDADQVVALAQSERLAESLAARDTEVSLMTVPGGDHGFFGNSQELWMEVEEKILPFMRAYFK